MKALSALAPEVRQYLLVTGNYWAFTLTDGALRMLVVLHFHALGYSPLQIAALFLFYELFGVITNLVGGYLGARLGLNRTMNIGLGIQVAALLMLTVPVAWLTIPWVMGAQALSGIAKDLNKMSAKSSIKLLVPDGQQGKLYKWVAILTGSKNALKGVGFFLGGALLALIGFKGALLAMAGVLALIWVSSMIMLKKDPGQSKSQAQVSRHPVQEQGNQHPFSGANVPVRRPRCLVCGGLAGVPEQRVRLGLLEGWRLLGGLGHRLWHRPVVGPEHHRQKKRPRSGWAGSLRLGGIAGGAACSNRLRSLGG
ncbi:MFS transporter [Pseudomonas sp. G2-4]|uniref:MFS transporter n=1 Tax=Pseudomonas sp. G2-4 TaxID=1506334 RepID=UPI003313BD93